VKTSITCNNYGKICQLQNRELHGNGDDGNTVVTVDFPLFSMTFQASGYPEKTAVATNNDLILLKVALRKSLFSQMMRQQNKQHNINMT